MTTYYLNGSEIQEGSDITLNGFTYPYEWLEGTSPSIRASLGIEATGDVNYDSKYYWAVDLPKNLDDKEETGDMGVPLYVQVWDPEAVVEGTDRVGAMVNTTNRLIGKGLKTTCTSEIKSTANNLLKPTDYYILRNAVESTEIPAAVSTYRAGVVAEQNRLEIAIAAVTSIGDLITVMRSANWGELK